MNSLQKKNFDLVDAPELVSAPRSGRVAWDERGNSIWEWQTAPGVFSREISSQQLEQLEASNLHIVDMEHVNAHSMSGRLHTGQRTKRMHKPDKGIFEKLLLRLGLPA